MEKAKVPTRKILLFVGITLLIAAISFQLIHAKTRSHKHEPPLNLLRDVPYIPDGKNPFQSLDLYIPKHPKANPIPVIVWIHGGAWVSGDKNHPPAAEILSHGFAVASLNYRLSNTSNHPAQIFDCKAAIRYLRAHAKEYNLDPERIGVWGHSAGGHLAALVGTSGGVKELEGDLGNNEQSSRVQAVVEWAGPSDLTTCADQAPPNCRIDFKSPSNPIAVLMGPNKSWMSLLAASPVRYLSKDDPPMMILHAEDDDVVPVGQAKELDELYKEIGLPQKCHIVSHGGHALSNPDFVRESLDFFDEHLDKN